MHSYRHQISGIFEQRSNAYKARDALIKTGIPVVQISITRRLASTGDTDQTDDGSDVYERVLVMACIGGVAGIFLASLTELVFVIMDQNASHAEGGISSVAVLYSAVMMGIIIGAVAGVIMGDAQARQHPLSRGPALAYQSVRLWIGNKQMKLSVMTYSAKETEVVAAVMYLSAHDYCDLKLVSS